MSAPAAGGGPLAPAIAAAAGLAAGTLARVLVLPLLRRAAARSPWRYDDVAVEAVRGPVVLWGLLIGLRVALRLAQLSPRTESALGLAVLAIGILSVTWAAARFVGGALRAGAAAGSLPGVSLIANLARAAVFAIGILITLQTLGIAITPIIGALGVGGLAVGLALQPTLANFFAGLRILAARQIRPGDFVRLETGVEGTVTDIAWGQTTIRQPANNLVILPNARLAESVTTNFSLPDRPQAFVVPLGVAYGSDLELVERVTVAVATEVMREVAPALLGGFTPVVRFTAFADSSITFNAVLRAPSYDERYLMQHLFIKRIHARYAAEGIEIPFPVRTVITRGGAG